MLDPDKPPLPADSPFSLPNDNPNVVIIADCQDVSNGPKYTLYYNTKNDYIIIPKTSLNIEYIKKILYLKLIVFYQLIQLM